MTAEIIRKIDATPEGIVEFLLECPLNKVMEIQRLAAEKGLAVGIVPMPAPVETPEPLGY